MPAIGEILDFRQAQKRLMDERRRIESLPGHLGRQFCGRETAKLIVNHRTKLGRGRVVPLNLAQDFREVAHEN